jgi:beta-aspartyl-peptidase (threonine type)
MGMAIIVHGGAGAIAPERHASAREGCHAAALAGWEALLRGGSAMDAIEVAIMAMENNPGFNAGTGSVLTSDGRAQMDAGVMDGETLDVGAVAGIERVKNPVALARLVSASQHVLLVGAGAELFATEQGVELVEPQTLVTAAQLARWKRGYRDGDDVNVGPKLIADSGFGAQPDEHIHSNGDKHGTVGAVAIDRHGRIAAGASTGGMAGKHPGRVGDTPLVGCGYYAETPIGGASCTGHGEHFMRLILAKRAVDLVERGMSAQAAADAAIETLGQRTGGTGGLILLDAEGNVGFARNTAAMAYAYMREEISAPEAGV